MAGAGVDGERGPQLRVVVVAGAVERGRHRGWPQPQPRVDLRRLRLLERDGGGGRGVELPQGPEREGERPGVEARRAQQQPIEPLQLRAQVEFLPCRDHVVIVARIALARRRQPRGRLAEEPRHGDVGRPRRHLQEGPHHLGQTAEVDPLARPGLAVAEQQQVVDRRHRRRTGGVVEGLQHGVRPGRRSAINSVYDGQVLSRRPMRDQRMAETSTCSMTAACRAGTSVRVCMADDDRPLQGFSSDRRPLFSRNPEEYTCPQDQERPYRQIRSLFRRR